MATTRQSRVLLEDREEYRKNRARLYREAHREKARAYSRQYYRDNHERLLENKLFKWNHNLGHIRDKSQAYYVRRKSYINKYRQLYYYKHKKVLDPVKIAELEAELEELKLKTA